MKLQTKQNRSSTRRDKEKRSKVKGNKVDQDDPEEYRSDEANEGKKQNKRLNNEKTRTNKTNETANGTVDELHNDDFVGKNVTDTVIENKPSKLKKKNRKAKKFKGDIDKVDGFSAEDGSNNENDNGEKGTNLFAAPGWTEFSEPNEEGKRINSKTGKTKRSRKTKIKDCLSSRKDEKMQDKKELLEQDEVYQISSGDEDSSRGMKKWITEYHQSRRGLKILQQRIDDFITIHEEQEEQARKEREAQAAEDGWTVVVHHKGRKKTTDSESGVTVGSVSQAAVVDNMAKKKKKEVGLDFYRFQKREANRSEILSLQNKFEQDKKRIQQLRAARKFRPY